MVAQNQLAMEQAKPLKKQKNNHFIQSADVSALCILQIQKITIFHITPSLLNS